MMKKCLKCEKDFYVKPSRVKAGRGKFCSKNCFDMDQRENPRNSGVNAYQWKGDNAGYIAKHKWIRKHFDKATRCGSCGAEDIFGSDGRNGIQWANISGKYKRDRDDWTQLCTSCHRKYDNYGETMRKLWKEGVYANRGIISG